MSDTFRDKIKAYVDDYWYVPCKDHTVWVYYAGINTEAEIRNHKLNPAEWKATFLEYNDPTYGSLEGLYIIKAADLPKVKGGAREASKYPDRIMISSWYDKDDKNAANPEVNAQNPKYNGLNDCAHYVTECLAAGGINVRTRGVGILLNNLQSLSDTKTLAKTVSAANAKRIIKAGIMKQGDVIIYSLKPNDHHHSVVYMGNEKISMHTWANHPTHPTIKGDWEPSASKDHPLVTLIHFGRDDGVFPSTSWVTGWWEVTWQGTLYYYYFDKTGHVSYTKRKPSSLKQPLHNADGKGYWFEVGNKIKLCWTSTGSLEEFTVKPPYPISSMEGTWNNSDKLVARKMF